MISQIALQIARKAFVSAVFTYIKNLIYQLSAIRQRYIIDQQRIALQRKRRVRPEGGGGGGGGGGGRHRSPRSPDAPARLADHLGRTTAAHSPAVPRLQRSH